MYAGYDVYPSTQQPSRPGLRNCALWIIVLLLLLFGWWLCAGSSLYGERTIKAYGDRMGCALPQASSTDSVQPSSSDQRGTASSPVSGYVAHPGSSQNTPDPVGTLSFTPNVSFPSGAPYMANSFAPSSATAEFYQTFNPQSLSQMMPASWRPQQAKGQKESCDPQDPRFNAFSRYTISPEAVQRAENMEGIIRLRESSMTTNSKALGMPNLLGNAVIPLKAVPIGDSAFFCNDSQLRQGYIASATGAYPVETNC